MTSRSTWNDLPSRARERVQAMLGAPVCSTRTAMGGFSPSLAEIVTGANGRSVFVKAVTPRINAESDRLNRREAGYLSSLPPSVPAPRLLDSFTSDEWFVLVIEEAPGSAPDLPWRVDQLDSVLRALHTLQEMTTPTPLPRTPSLPDDLGEDLRGFDRIAEEPPGDLDPWIASRLDALRAAADRGIPALAGQTLCHSDLRADNVLIHEGTVTIVDWAWVTRASPFADALLLMGSVDDRDGHLQLDSRIDAVMRTHRMPREVATDVLSGLLGFFVDSARRPSDPTLPTLQAHRRASRDRLLITVRRRWEAEGRP